MARQATAVRQGDVLLIPVAVASGTPVQPVGDRFILAEGEQTGHHHSIDVSPYVSMLADGDRSFVTVTKQSVRLKHQEHSALKIVPANYEVVLQRRALPGSEHHVIRVVD